MDGLEREWSSTCWLSLELTTFSIILKRKVRFEIDRYELRSCGFIVLFLSRGRTIAFLQSCGNVICWRDELQMAAMIEAKILLALRHALQDRWAGAGSAWHCLAGDRWMIFATSSAAGLTGDRSESGCWATRSTITDGAAVAVDARMRLVLATKWHAKSSAVSGVSVSGRKNENEMKCSLSNAYTRRTVTNGVTTWLNGTGFT